MFDLVLLFLGIVLIVIPAMLLLERSPAIKVTMFHLEPYVVRPGQKVEAVWVIESLREGCRGTVQRRMIDSDHRIFAFSPVPAVIHGLTGSMEVFRTAWMIPIGISAGPAVLQRSIERWCNPLQKWIWPMREFYEAGFTVVE